MLSTKLESWTYGMLAVMGVLYFLPPPIFIFFRLVSRWGCRKAFGKCVRIERNYDPESESTLIQPVIEFADRDGQTHELRTGTGHGLRYMPRVGSTVKVYYRPDSHPFQAHAVHRGMWQVSAVLMLVGLLLMLPAFLWFFFR